MTHLEKSCRRTCEQLQGLLLPQISDFRELTKPVRRKSHYPTMLAVENSLKSVLSANAELQETARRLEEEIDEVQARARRERVERL